MNSLLFLGGALICFSVAYRLYARFLGRTFELDSRRKTPAYELRDDVDYAPAKNWWVLFGHHFSSICGAGPIVGPVLACAYWGWGVSLIWLVIGAIWMGAVSDFTSLVMSVRSKGQSIAQIAGEEISKNVKVYFSIFLWLSLILVIAVFSIFAAKTLISEPTAVIPSLGLIPVAVLTGWFLYHTRVSNFVATLMGSGLLVLLLELGFRYPVRLAAVGTVSPENLWILILLGYCFVASVVPVTFLLQPRDYLASFILFAMVFTGIAGIVVTQPAFNLPVYTSFMPADWPAAGPLWPMLFVTIACGAISGFHSLVSSGTTCKQIADESHCRRIGYGGMLVESTVGILVLIAVSAGLGSLQLRGLLKEGGPIAAFSHGYGALTSVFLKDYGVAFAVLALNSFILTTLDTATRITRYITTEVFKINNMFLATFLVVTASGAMALTGKWNLLWPAFGAANQLIAGITLLVATCWLLNRSKPILMTLIPALVMLITTIAAFGWQFLQSFSRQNPEGMRDPDWMMMSVTAVLIVISISVLFETFQVLQSKRRSKTVL